MSVSHLCLARDLLHKSAVSKVYKLLAVPTMINFTFDLVRRLKNQQFGIFLLDTFWVLASHGPWREHGDKKLKWKRWRLRICCRTMGAVATLLGAVWRVLASGSGTFPSLFCVLVKFLAQSMIRNTIHCNDYNSDRLSLAYLYVHVGIPLGNTHALLQALTPINKPSYLHTIPKHTLAVCTTWGSGCFILLCHTKEQTLI